MSATTDISKSNTSLHGLDPLDPHTKGVASKRGVLFAPPINSSSTYPTHIMPNPAAISEIHPKARLSKNQNLQHATFVEGILSGGLRPAIGGTLGDQKNLLKMVLLIKRAELAANATIGKIDEIDKTLGIEAINHILLNIDAYTDAVQSRVWFSGCRTPHHMDAMGLIQAEMVRLTERKVQDKTADAVYTAKLEQLQHAEYANNVINAGQSTNDVMTTAAVLVNIDFLSQLKERLQQMQDVLNKQIDTLSNPALVDIDMIIVRIEQLRDKALSGLSLGATAAGNGATAKKLLEQGGLYKELTDALQYGGVIKESEKVNHSCNMGRATVDTSLFRSIVDDVLKPLNELTLALVTQKEAQETQTQQAEYGVSLSNLVYSVAAKLPSPLEWLGYKQPSSIDSGKRQLKTIADLQQALYSFNQIEMSTLLDACNTGANHELNSKDQIFDYVMPAIMERLAQQLVLHSATPQMQQSALDTFNHEAPKFSQAIQQFQAAKAQADRFSFSVSELLDKNAGTFILGSTEKQPAIGITTKYYFTTYIADLRDKYLASTSLAELMLKETAHVDIKAQRQHYSELQQALSKKQAFICAANDLCKDLQSHAFYGGITLKKLAPGSSIMPGKVNPLLPESIQRMLAELASIYSNIQKNADKLSLSQQAYLLERASLFEYKVLEELNLCLSTLTVSKDNFEEIAKRGMLATALRYLPLPNITASGLAYTDEPNETFGYDRAKNFNQLCINHGYIPAIGMLLEDTFPNQNVSDEVVTDIDQKLRESLSHDEIDISQANLLEAA